MINPHKNFPTGLFDMFHSLWLNRQLIVQMVKREVLGRYRGSGIGIAWSFLNPILMLAIYTFVFSEVFKARWGLSAGETRIDFAIVLFVGLIIHGLFSECINRAPSLILDNPDYVKKVVFPLETLPWIAMGSALFHAIVSLFILVVANFIMNHQLHWTAAFIPLILLPLVLVTVGLTLILASLGVYARDIGQVTGIFTTIMLFVSPVFYPISALPKQYQSWLQLNPMAFILEEGRNALIFGITPDWVDLGISIIAGILVVWCAFWWFQKTRKGFADVL